MTFAVFYWRIQCIHDYNHFGTNFSFRTLNKIRELKLVLKSDRSRVKSFLNILSERTIFAKILILFLSLNFKSPNIPSFFIYTSYNQLLLRTKIRFPEILGLTYEPIKNGTR